jgi:hypothetical protein
MPLILGTNSIKDTGYDVANSLRFDDGSSDHLTKTASTPTNNKKQTSSVWVKRSALSGSSNFGIMGFVDTSSPSNSRHHLYFINDQLGAFYKDPTITRLDLKTNRLFRDPSAWMHIVLAIDTTQGTASDRAKLYVNGVQETSFATSDYPVQDITFLDSGETLQVGRLTTSGGSQQYYDGYIAEAVFIDGQALDPTSFGEFDEDSPTIWKPKDVSGLTFGNNGFYLDFENASSLGADVSGNSNNFTVNNLTSVDQSTDTCTNNFATFNPLDKAQSSATYSEGNLKWTTTSGYFWNRSTIGVSSGKWYFEAKLTSAPQHAHVGIVDEAPDDNSDSIEGGTYNWGYKNSSGEIYNNGSGSSYGSTYTTGDIIGVYLDLDHNKLYFAKNGAIQNSGTGISITDPASTDTGNYFFAVGDNASATNGTWEANFGSPAFSISSGNSDPNGYGNFEYSPNDGGSASFDSTAKSFYALNTKNLAEFG